MPLLLRGGMACLGNLAGPAREGWHPGLKVFAHFG